MGLPQNLASPWISATFFYKKNDRKCKILVRAKKKIHCNILYSGYLLWIVDISTGERVPIPRFRHPWHYVHCEHTEMEYMTAWPGHLIAGVDALSRTIGGIDH